MVEEGLDLKGEGDWKGGKGKIRWAVWEEMDLEGRRNVGVEEGRVKEVGRVNLDEVLGRIQFKGGSGLGWCEGIV